MTLAVHMLSRILSLTVEKEQENFTSVEALNKKSVFEVDFVLSRRCSDPPECKQGIITKDCKCIPCPSGKYRVVRSGHRRCEICTQRCSAERHLVQIKDCTANTNRECHCDKGYFCDSPAQFSCRRCIPCPDGTFRDTTSRQRSCKQHTDCESLGMALISVGNRTHDHVCEHLDHVITSPVHRVHITMEQKLVVKEATVSPSTVSAKSLETKIVTSMRDTHNATHYHSRRSLTGADPMASPQGLSTHKTLSGLTTASDQLGVQKVTKQNSVVIETAGPPSTVSTKSFAVETETATIMWNSQTATHYHSAGVLMSAFPVASVQGQTAHNFQYWPVIVVFIILAILMLGFGKCYKKKASQKKCLPPVENLDQVTLEAEGGASPSVLRPLVSHKGEGPSFDGAETSPGGLQQFTVDHSRGRENVSNTVGSIFIYSPGTVILGTSASDQKGEAGEQPDEEDQGPEEGQVITSAPQQESREENKHPVNRGRALQGPSVRGGVEEAEKNELSYPIPATGK